MAPTYDVDFFGMHEVEDRYGKRWRPTGPIVRVPIMDHDQAWRFGSLPRPQSYAYMQQDILMRPVSWTVRMNDTHVRWYNWEPVWEPVHQMGCFGDAEADIYSAVGKMLVYMDRFRMAFHYMPLDSYSIFGGAFTLREFIVWFEELKAAMQEWRGKIRAFYVVPGKKPGDPPEERAR